MGSERSRMVSDQLRARDITDRRVLDAMRKVPRHLFVPEPQRAKRRESSAAHRPRPDHLAALHRGVMTQASRSTRVIACSRSEPDRATRPRSSASSPTRSTPSRSSSLSRARRRDTGGKRHENVHVRHGNGYLGWPEHAPYDRIMVTAAPDEVPPALVEQLTVDGLMAIPVGTFNRSCASCAGRPLASKHSRRSGPIRAHDRQAEAGSGEMIRRIKNRPVMLRTTRRKMGKNFRT